MKIYSLIALLLVITGCKSTSKLDHSFFIAGHTYGNPQEKGETKGLYPPFKEKIPYINEQQDLDMGFLLGDVVWLPKAWPEAEQDIAKFKMPIHQVRGNHDGKIDFYKEKFGDTYKKFTHKNNLYIILDSNLAGWNISGEQLVFLMNTLRNDGKKANNIFVFVHHLLWHSKEKFPHPIPNSTYGSAPKINFWTRIEPLLQAQEKPVFLFAGDMGAFSKEFRKQKGIIEYFYHERGNLTFIGTGMGGGKRDNFVIVDVSKDQTVDFRLIHLNGDNIDGLGKLKDYRIEN